MKRNVVVALTGASGATYCLRLVECLLAAGVDVHLSISNSGQAVLSQELDIHIDLEDFDARQLMLREPGDFDDRRLNEIRSLAGISSDKSNVLSVKTGEPGQLHYYHYRDHLARIASGSFLTDGMVICPCSCGTLSSIVHGTSMNLIHRAAEVHLKEGRTLVVVPRETPLSLVQLTNLKLAAEFGAVVLPAMPGFYHGVKTIQDLIDFVVSRICDQLDVRNGLIQRWSGPPVEGGEAD